MHHEDKPEVPVKPVREVKACKNETEHKGHAWYDVLVEKYCEGRQRG